MVSLFPRKDALPVFFHVHDRPAIGLRFIEALVELTDRRLTVVGPFALGVRVVDIEAEAFRCYCPLPARGEGRKPFPPTDA